MPDGTGTVRSWVRLINAGPAPLTVTSVTSFLCGAAGDPAGLDVWWAGKDWLAEGRWAARALRDLLPDLGRPWERPSRGAASAGPAWAPGRPAGTCPWEH